MKKHLKVLVCGALVGALTLSMVGCGTANEGGDTADNGSDISVGIIVKTATNAHFHDIAYGACVAAKELGIGIKVDNTTSEVDTEGQITLCENMISAGCDAVILTPNDSDGMSSAVEACHSAGIPFVTADTQITNIWGDEKNAYIPNFIGAHNEDITYNLACNVFDALGGEGNVVILRGIDATSSSNERTSGFEKAIKEYPGITLIESQSANYSQDDAVNTMADIIQANDDIDAVLCCNDMMAVGACSALMENNIEVGKDGVLVAGVDGNIIALESIERGEMYATAYDWAILWGYLSVMQAYDLIQGKEVPEFTMTQTDCVITLDNLDEYMPHSTEVQEWGFSGKIPEEVSDYMYQFIEMGLEGVTEE
ncbi:MAG: sugar ABC transporter substrate-binding protein [Eubacterium sp.]|nr:sugar ABC transporter substrate-binding protein [Eubacterium sp.]